MIEQSEPLLGVVFAPALGEIYLEGRGLGAWRGHQQMQVPLAPKGRSIACRMAVSRFHDHSDVDLFAVSNRITERVAVGSALKYSHLAAGDVDVFLRLVGCSEWDTAAGQAVLEAAGGQVLNWHTGLPFHYGKPNRRNPRLLSIRAPYCREEFQLKDYEPELL